MFKLSSSRLLLIVLSLLLSACAQKIWISDWKETASFSAPLAGTASVVIQDKIYLMGGVDGREFVKTTEYAEIQPDGTLSAWQQGHSLHEERGFMEAVVRGDYVYIIGGGNGPNGHHLLHTVERAHIGANGILDPWEKVDSQMMVGRRCSKIIATADRLYSFGGYGGVLLDSVEYAEIKPDGTLGEWTLDPEVMTLPRYVNSVKMKGDRFFIIGGHDRTKGVGITDVEWTRYTKAGNTKKWQATTPLQTGRYALSSASHGDHMYAMGGLSGAEYLDSIERTTVGKNGELSPWEFTTPLDQPRANFSVASYDNRLYVIGGTNRDGYLASVIYANYNNAGDLGYWGSKEDAQAAQEKKRKRAAFKSNLPNQGEVIELIQAAAYTYIKVRNHRNAIEWVAGPKIADLETGDYIAYSKGVNMSGWFSKELQRAFDMVLFVGQVRKQ